MKFRQIVSSAMSTHSTFGPFQNFVYVIYRPSGSHKKRTSSRAHTHALSLSSNIKARLLSLFTLLHWANCLCSTHSHTRSNPHTWAIDPQHNERRDRLHRTLFSHWWSTFRSLCACIGIVPGCVRSHSYCTVCGQDKQPIHNFHVSLLQTVIWFRCVLICVRLMFEISGLSIEFNPNAQKEKKEKGSNNSNNNKNNNNKPRTERNDKTISIVFLRFVTISSFPPVASTWNARREHPAYRNSVHENSTKIVVRTN